MKQIGRNRLICNFQKENMRVFSFKTSISTCQKKIKCVFFKPVNVTNNVFLCQNILLIFCIKEKFYYQQILLFKQSVYRSEALQKRSPCSWSRFRDSKSICVATRIAAVSHQTRDKSSVCHLKCSPYKICP